MCLHCYAFDSKVKKKNPDIWAIFAFKYNKHILIYKFQFFYFNNHALILAFPLNTNWVIAWKKGGSYFMGEMLLTLIFLRYW